MASDTTASKKPFGMRREINVLSAVSIIVGTIIGSGIFISPSAIVANTGSVALCLIMWVVPAILTLLIILCYTELVSLIPKAGGEYVYFKEALGPLFGFLFAWTNGIILLPSFYATLSLTASNYMLNHFIRECSMQDSIIKITSILLLVTVVAVNCVYVRYITRVQTLLTSLKVIALVIIIVSGLVKIASGHTKHLDTGFEGSEWSAGAIAVSIQVGIFGYFGWQGVFSLVEEVKNPQRTIPISFTISMILVTALYVLTNVAYFSVMSPQVMLESPAVAMTFAKKTLGGFSLVIPLCVALNIVGTLNASLLAMSRVYFAAARDGLFPSLCATIHTKYRTPWPGLFLLCVISLVYIIMGNTMQLIQYMGVILTLNFVVIGVSVLYLRWTQPKLHRPVQVPLVLPMLALALSVSLMALGVYQQPRNSLFVIAIIASGVPAYALGVMWQPKPRELQQALDKVSMWVQKSLMVAYTDEDPPSVY